MPRCKPGDLCVIVKGPDTGLSVTVLSAATVDDVSRYAAQVHQRWISPDVREQLWQLDKNVLWRDSKGRCEDMQMPFEGDSWLMPIGKKQDEKQTKKEAEKTP